MNVVQETVFDIACDIENPLLTIDDLLEALGLIGETMGNDGNVVMRLAMLAQGTGAVQGGRGGA
ncbi:hypothetical protein ACG873_01370 (plasmid) [Mesorhizobium sp. AaZ16]|uniref:hypothetical protein n=1 Tax=Mesorhizobium sp. AaZ16 TaxID=3402289 RepID=UPI00374FA970